MGARRRCACHAVLQVRSVALASPTTSRSAGQASCTRTGEFGDQAASSHRCANCHKRGAGGCRTCWAVTASSGSSGSKHCTLTASAALASASTSCCSCDRRRTQAVGGDGRGGWPQRAGYRRTSRQLDEDQAIFCMRMCNVLSGGQGQSQGSWRGMHTAKNAEKYAMHAWRNWSDCLLWQKAMNFVETLLFNAWSTTPAGERAGLMAAQKSHAMRQRGRILRLRTLVLVQIDLLVGGWLLDSDHDGLGRRRKAGVTSETERILLW